jgi:hypothetical protein
MRTSFYTYFSSGFGTIWMLIFGWSFITSNRFNIGEFGLIAIPVIAIVYAWVRRSSDADRLAQHHEPAKPES